MSNEEAKKEYEKIIGFVVTIFMQYAIGQGQLQQGNYSLRRPPKLTIPQAVIGQRWATVNSNLYKQTVIHSKSTS